MFFYADYVKITTEVKTVKKGAVMKKLLLLAVCAAFVFGLGCSKLGSLGGAPRLDMTNETTMKASAEKMMASMSKEKQQEFSQAIATIAVYVMINNQDITKSKTGADAESALMQKIKTYLDSKTADQIIAQAKQFQDTVDAFSKNIKK